MNSGALPFISSTWKKNPCRWNGWSIKLAFRTSHICNSPTFTDLSDACVSPFTRKSMPLVKPSPTENLTFRLTTAPFDARGWIDLIIPGLENKVGWAFRTLTSPYFFLPDFTMVIRLYGNDSIGKLSPSVKGPTKISTRSPGTRRTSSASTGASIKPPSVAIIRNFFPPK